MAFDIFIHSSQTSPSMESEGRSGLEDDIEGFLRHAGHVSGAGFGIGSLDWNVDLELFEDVCWREWVKKIVSFLREWGVPADTTLAVVPPGWEEGQDTLEVHVYDDAHPYVEVVRPPAEDEDHAEPEPRAADLPQLGDTFLVPLGENEYGACRVIRVASGEYATLVAGTDWYGDRPPPISEASLHSLVMATWLGAVGPSCTWWLSGKPPKEFRHLGVIEPTPADLGIVYGQYNHNWEMVAGSLRMHRDGPRRQNQ